MKFRYTCPKCGKWAKIGEFDLEIIPMFDENIDGEAQFDGISSIIIRCPKCGHEEDLDY